MPSFSESSMSSKNDSKSRCRTPPPPRGENPEGGDLANDFDNMWATLEPKLSEFKGEVKDAVKNLVVGKIEELEKRMDKKFDEAKTEAKDVKAAVEQIEQILAKSFSVPALGTADFPPSSSPPASYAAAASSKVGAPFPGPVAFPPPRSINISPDELNASKFWRRPDEMV